MHVRIGKLVIDLDQCALQEVTDSMKTEAISVMTVTGQVLMTYFEDRDQAEYRALKAYMAKRMPLEIYNMQSIRGEMFDPFLDELASTLYSLFQSLPGSEDMVLSLLHDGSGGIWHGAEKEQRVENALVHWRTMDEALGMIQTLKTRQEA